jgi:succinate-acetate transporter protein
MVRDMIGGIAFASFGLWWLLFPRSVLRFYGAFHRGQIELPKPLGVRLAGGLWLILLSAFLLSRLFGS